MPIAKFEMPDGRIAKFEVPEGTTPEQAQEQAMQFIAGQDTGDAQPSQTEPPSDQQQEPSLMDNANAMIPRWVAEGAAAMNRPVMEFLDFLGPDTANAVLSLAEKGTEMVTGNEQDFPRVPTLMDSVPGAQGNFMEGGLARDVVRGAGETATMAATGGAGLRQMASKVPEFGASVSQNVLKQMAATAPAADVVLGAASGAGAEVGDEYGGAPGALAGGMIAPLAPAGALLTAKRAGNKMLIEAAPAVDQIKTQARRIYKAIDDQGAVISPKSFSKLVNDLNVTAQKSGADRTIHPKVNAVLARFNDDIGNAPTTSEMDVLRRVARAATESNEVSEVRIGKILVDKIDDYMDNLNPTDFFLEGDGTNIGKQYKQARELWSRSKKSETLQGAITKAQDQASGFENGLRVQFRQILNNPKKLRGFTGEEKKAMRQVVQGTSAANTAKLIGKLGFSENQATQLVGTSIGIGGGAAIAGPGGAVAVPLLGQVSKKLAQTLTKNNAELSDAIVRSGRDGTALVKAYMKSVPAKDRNAQELGQILLKRNADTSKLQGSNNKLINDASFIAGALSQENENNAN